MSEKKKDREITITPEQSAMLTKLNVEVGMAQDRLQVAMQAILLGHGSSGPVIGLDSTRHVLIVAAEDVEPDMEISDTQVASRA